MSLFCFPRILQIRIPRNIFRATKGASYVPNNELALTTDWKSLSSSFLQSVPTLLTYCISNYLFLLLTKYLTLDGFILAHGLRPRQERCGRIHGQDLADGSQAGSLLPGILFTLFKSWMSTCRSFTEWTLRTHLPVPSTKPKVSSCVHLLTITDILSAHSSATLNMLTLCSCFLAVDLIVLIFLLEMSLSTSINTVITKPPPKG